MKNLVKTSKWLRWTAAGAFGLMLTLNVMVGLEFEKGKMLPSLTLKELGNMAFAMGEQGCITTPGSNVGACLRNTEGSFSCVVGGSDCSSS